MQIEAPPRAIRCAPRAALLVAALVAALAPGCGRDPGEVLIEDSAKHMEAAIELLEAHKGDAMKLMEAVLTYRQDHRTDLLRIQREGEALRTSLKPGEAKALAERGNARLRPLMHDIERLAAAYPEPRFVLRVIRPLTVPAGTRAPPPGTKPAWMPEPPPLPPGLPAEATEGAAATHDHRHRHDHGAHGPSGRGPPDRRHSP